MDDEDDRRLLDIIGDVDLLNDYLHGSNSKSIGEDDVTNAAYGSDGTFFAGNAAGADAALKDGSSTMGEFGEEDSAGAGGGLQLSSSLSFIEDELGGTGGGSPEGGVGVDPLGGGGGGEDAPFDILQKSLMEADITEHTLAQEAMLDSQPAPPPPPVSLPSQLVSAGGYGVVTAGGQFIQGVSQALPNGSSHHQHIQVLGSFGAGCGGVMTLSGLERSPQILFRPSAAGPVATGAAGGAGTVAGGAQVFAAPTQVGQVQGLKNIPLQNFIIQRGPGGTQTLVRHIQPKPAQGGGGGAQTVYSLQPAPLLPSSAANANNANVSPAGQYAANGSIVVQQQQQTQTGQFLQLAAPAPPALQNGPAPPDPTLVATNQNTVQLVAGQTFTATPGGQLIVNHGGVVGGGPVAQQTTWAGFPPPGSNPNAAAAQTPPCASGRITLVGPALAGGGAARTAHVQRLLVTQSQNCTAALSPLPNAGSASQEQDYRLQDCASPGGSRQGQQVNTMTAFSQDPTTLNNNAQVSTLKRPALPQLTRGGMMLQQLRKDHAGVDNSDRRRFTSLDDTLLRLLPYHVFSGAPPSADEFSHVDEEFEAVATHVLKKTQAMVNKYRRLLIVEAERSSPSSEMVMIDRTFNQEERNNLTQDRRMVLVDPDGFQEDFCCGVKHSPAPPEPLPPSPSQPPPPPLSPGSSGWTTQSHHQTAGGSMDSSTEPPYRTDPRTPGYGDPRPGYGDPGGGGDNAPLLDSRSVLLDLKRSQQQQGGGYGGVGGYPPHPGTLSPPAGQMHYQASPPGGASPPPPPDTDSVLEAAVNSILEC